jgi:hypothetical protein
MTPRVQWRERQRVTAADLRLEQAYRLGVAGRHHVTHHAWGVVRGLQVVADATAPGGYSLTPGVAIDGYGRELVVPARVALAAPQGERRWCVLLAYCEAPESVPAGRTCVEQPAARIRQRTVCVVAGEDAWVAPADDGGDVGVATAAGAIEGRPPWPVLVACVEPGAEGSEVDTSSTRYVRHRAGAFASPSGRAALQLGLAGASDFYPFALATRGPGAALERRWAVDRGATVHVWRPLVVAGGRAMGEAELPDGKLLRVELPLAAVRPGAWVEAVLDREARAVRATLFEPGAPAAAPLAAAAKVKVAGPLDVALALGGGPAGRIALLDAATLEPVAIAAAKRQTTGKRAKAAATDAAEEARRETIRVDVAEAGGRLRVRSPDGDAPAALVLVPAAKLDPSPLARELHAVVTSKPTDPVPASAVRLCGGALDDSDTSSRLSLGGRSKGTFRPALWMNGAGAIDIPGPAGDPDHSAPLVVTRTVHLAPIGKKDPLVQELLPLAFIAGLRRMGKVVSGLTANVKKAGIRRGPKPEPRSRRAARDETDATLEYTLDLVGFGAGVQIEHALETVAGIARSTDVIVRTITDELQGARTGEHQIELERFMHSASTVRVQVQLLVKKDGVTGVVVSAAQDVSVEGDAT